MAYIWERSKIDVNIGTAKSGWQPKAKTLGFSRDMTAALLKDISSFVQVNHVRALTRPNLVSFLPCRVVDQVTGAYRTFGEDSVCSTHGKTPNRHHNR